MAEIKGIAEKLSQIERSCLGALSDGREKNFKEVADNAKISIDSVRRAASWLKDKKLVDLREIKKDTVFLSGKGKNAIQKGLPEKRFVETIARMGGKASAHDLEHELRLGKEFNFALGFAKKNAFVSVQKEKNEIVMVLSGLVKDFLEKENALDGVLKKVGRGEKLSAQEDKVLNELIERRLVERKNWTERKVKLNPKGFGALELLQDIKAHINVLNAKMLDTGAWKGRPFRKYNIKDPVPETFAGKKQPYLAFLQQIRRKLTELGFEEMRSPLITQEFYNFDVLFQPQSHPARAWTDTYQMKTPKKGKLPHAHVVKKVKEAHEFGGKGESVGWKYSWSEHIAQKLVPAAHATAHSARQLVKGIKIPGKYFSIARCYRPDVVDSTHLVEFNQMEGFVVDESFNFRHLLGMLKSFAVEIAGAAEVKFVPSYFPFTEPSAEMHAKHPKMGWMELGGSGMFRPEMMEAVGIEAPALAWGLGIDRLAMFAMGTEDIRNMFSDDLKWLREQKLVK